MNNFVLLLQQNKNQTHVDSQKVTVKTTVYINNNVKLKEYTTKSMKMGNTVYSQNIENDVYYNSQFTIQIIHINKQIIIHNSEIGERLLNLSTNKIDPQYFINDSLHVETNIKGSLYKLYRKTGDYNLIEYNFNSKGLLTKTIYHQQQTTSQKNITTVLEYSFSKITEQDFTIKLSDIVTQAKEGWKPSKKYTGYSVNDNTSH